MLRAAAGIGAVTGAYGVSFGAVAVAAGLSPLQACTLSLLMFTGGSQFAMVGAIAGGAQPLAGAATAVLLGIRNAFYGLRLSPVLGVRGGRRLVAAHLVIDESAAMGGAQSTVAAGRLAFWATGSAVFVGWNAMTLVGAVGAAALSDPAVLGLDVAGPAAFVALLAPRLRDVETWAVALTAATVGVAAAPLVPSGVPVLLAAGVAVAAGLIRRGPVAGDDLDTAPAGDDPDPGPGRR